MSQAVDSAPVATTAQGAVSTVLKVVDLQAANPQSGTSSATLHFQIGGSNLSVHIELQGGTVHTQFSTPSSELRNAVATAWQSVSGNISTKAVHFAEPSFSSSNGSSQQQDSSMRWSDGQAQQQRHASAEDYGAATSYTSTASGDEDAEPALATSSGPAPSLLSNRLQTFA